MASATPDIRSPSPLAPVPNLYCLVTVSCVEAYLFRDTGSGQRLAGSVRSGHDKNCRLLQSLIYNSAGTQFRASQTRLNFVLADIFFRLYFVTQMKTRQT